jgi:nucleoside 2-deoxyribosyltransferase
MILRGILERSLGGFICIRGYAKLSELAKLSRPNDQYQRSLVDKHRQDLEGYLNKREYVFFPEVTLSYTLNPEQDNIKLSVSNELLSLSESKGKTLSIKQFNKSYASKSDNRDTDLIRIVTIDIFDILADGLFQRIDGNHRLSAAENLDASISDIQTPYCLILLSDNDADAKQQSVIFHNINSKGLALTSEENLKAILDNNRFSEEELSRNFGWTYLKAKKLAPEVDKDYLHALNHVFSDSLRTVLIQSLQFLEDHKLVNKDTAIKSIKQKLTIVNQVFIQEPKIQACLESGLLVAFLYYAFKDSHDEITLITAFKNWVLRNHIHEIKEIDAGSIVDVFNKVHESQIKIFMAMPYYSDSEVTNYNTALGNAISTIKQTNPQLNLMHHPIMSNHSPAHDMIADILNKIQTCDIFIADITNNNANVTYEYGYARGQNKACVLLRKKTNEQAVKSDYTNDLRFEFEGDFDLQNKLQTEIEHTLKAQGFEVN